jgi:hypothetical protein
MEGGGPAGYSHLPKVAVPQKMDEPRFKSGLNNERMTTHKPAKDLLADDDVATWYANLEEGSVITTSNKGSGTSFDLGINRERCESTVRESRN